MNHKSSYKIKIYKYIIIKENKQTKLKKIMKKFFIKYLIKV